MVHTKKISTVLAQTAKIMGVPFYWLDINHVILGANDLAVSALGACSAADLIGKTPYDLYPHDLAHAIVLHHQTVISNEKTLVVEEAIKNSTTGCIHYYTATIWPLRDERDDSEEIIGTICTATDITAKKNAEKLLRNQKVLTHIAQVAEILPTPIYWLDTHQQFVGCNNLVLKGIGANFGKNDLIGKTPLDIYPEAMALDIMDHHREVVRTGKVFRGEEAIVDITTGEIAYFEAIVGPLHDDDGQIIGTIGTSLNTTEKKAAEQREIKAQQAALEHLRLEKELNQRIVKEQNRFRATVRKVAHDINSPLAALNMMLEACSELAEDKRSFLRRATESILDIANNLLNNNDEEENLPKVETEFRQPLLVSDLLVQLLSEKKVQYQEYPIAFEAAIAGYAQFAFIQMQRSEFRRAMSNLINNAVDALEGNKNGLVTIQLTADADTVIVKVQDNGMGMSRDNVEKILDRQGFTEGKQNGHGLGLRQVWDTLTCNQGTMAVQSSRGKGTSIQLTFPRIVAPSWIAQEIHLISENIIVILDDDESIHHAWDLRFNSFSTTYPSLCVHHFTQGQEALDFLNKLNPQQKDRVIFLSDYELLHQDQNGLEVIEAGQINSAMLVTSYYFDPKIRDIAAHLNVKILPKQMASIIPIDMVCAASMDMVNS